jgi:hypothetical protein
MLSELSAFADLGMGGGMKSNLDNEIEILKSHLGGKYGKKVKPEHPA